MRQMLVVPYDKNWINQYEKIKEELIHVFGDLALDIQHFGSTSIVGMSAKPIIDVMVIVSNIEKVDELNSQMIQLGYSPKGENGIAGRRYFQKLDIDGENHTQHIHCYEKNNQHVKDELMLRDYLRIDKQAFEYYQTVKIEASKKFRFSPQEYSDYKTICIDEIMKKARLLHPQ
jgi:GrpB-like predicted nucleotidyltransferase (UPF0157 family)